MSTLSIERGAIASRMLYVGAAIALVATMATAVERIERADGIYDYTDPTEAEIAAGEALVTRIAQTAERVPISDVSTWFSALGVTDWSVLNSPDFFYFAAQNRNSTQNASRNVAPGIKGTSIQVIKNEANRQHERIEISLDHAEVCLTSEQAKRAFSPRAEAIRHVVPRYQYGGAAQGTSGGREGERVVGRVVQKGEYDNLVFSPDKSRWPAQPFIRLGYGHQACAQKVTVSYGEYGSCNRDGISLCVVDTIIWHANKTLKGSEPFNLTSQ